MILDEKIILQTFSHQLLINQNSEHRLSLTAQIYSQALPALSTTTLVLDPNMPIPTLATLPMPILLRIIQHTFPTRRTPVPADQTPLIPDLDETEYTYVPILQRGADADSARHRRTLLWISTNLRLACRAMYFACMHTLRTTCLPAYQERIRAPYSTAAYIETPLPQFLHEAPLYSLSRETAVLDRFLLLKIRTDVLADESELHLGSEDIFRDLFDVAQPRARLEDLLYGMGVELGIILQPQMDRGSGPPGRRSIVGDNYGSTASLDLLKEVDVQMAARAAALEAAKQAAIKKKRSLFSMKKSSSKDGQSTRMLLPTIPPLPFSALSISFQPRRVGLVVARMRTIAEVTRESGRQGSLETLAEALVNELIQLMCG